MYGWELEVVNVVALVVRGPYSLYCELIEMRSQTGLRSIHGNGDSCNGV